MDGAHICLFVIAAIVLLCALAALVGARRDKSKKNERMTPRVADKIIAVTTELDENGEPK